MHHSKTAAEGVPEGWGLLFSKERIQKEVDGLVKDLLRIKGIRKKGVVLIQILEGARVFTDAIKIGLEENGIKVKVESVKASSYGGGPGERGTLTVEGLDEINLQGKEIKIVVDDMVDSGETMIQLTKKINAIFKGSPVLSLVLIKKLSSNFNPDYVAIKKVTQWIAGYGINGNSPEQLGEKDGRDLEDIIFKILTS